jgi:hypothetical protein
MNDISQHDGGTAGIVGRAKAILFSPRDEWPRIAGETDSVRQVFTGYVVPLVAIGPLAALIGGQLFGYGALGFSYHPSLTFSLTTAITTYVLGLASIFLIGWIANFLASKFGGTENFGRAFKLCAYSFTAAWLAGVFQLIPSLGILALLGLYSLYLFYLGATPMMGVPQDKATAYTAVTVVVAIIVNIVVGVIAGAITGGFGTAAAIAANDDAAGTMEMSLPGYGNLKVEDNGDRQTMEIPGMGKVEITKDGDTVKIEGENFNAEVKDPEAAE